MKLETMPIGLERGKAKTLAVWSRDQVEGSPTKVSLINTAVCKSRTFSIAVVLIITMIVAVRCWNVSSLTSSMDVEADSSAELIVVDGRLGQLLGNQSLEHVTE